MNAGLRIALESIRRDRISIAASVDGIEDLRPEHLVPRHDGIV
jgi:hypothetical protein